MLTVGLIEKMLFLLYNEFLMKKIEILVNTFSWMFLKANKVKSDKAYYGKDNFCTEATSKYLDEFLNSFSK